MKRTWSGSLVVGRLPEGCSLCMRGEKLVLFVTGLCAKRCYYCPLSSEKRGRDVVFANERPVASDEDVLSEAREMDAKGTGLTGGDPLLKPQRTLHYVKLLKEVFGPNHHVHLYTTTGKHVDREVLRRLAEAGLDEIRFHPDLASPIGLERIRWASDEGITTGLEVPAVPGMEEALKRLLIEAERLGASFVNINELEMNDENYFQLRLRGFKIKEGSLSGVEGSEELALKLLEWAENELSLNVHYCPSFIKDAYQYRNRLRRKAARLAKAYEEVTSEGLLRKGIVESPSLERLHGLKEALIKLGVDSKLAFLDSSRRVLELPVKVLEEAKRLGLLKDMEAYIVEEYPSFDRREASKTPLN